MDRFTYKDENGNYQLDDEYVEKLGIDINGLADITDYIGEKEDLEEKYNVNEKDIERALIVKKIIENGCIYYENEYGENFYYFGPELMFDFETNEIILSEEYDDDYFGKWEEIARLPILDYKKKYWLKKDKSE